MPSVFQGHARARISVGCTSQNRAGRQEERSRIDDERTARLDGEGDYRKNGRPITVGRAEVTVAEYNAPAFAVG